MILWALKAFGIVRQALSALFRLAGRYPWQVALIAALTLSGWLWMGKERALDQRDKARAETKAQAESYRTAQAEAAAMAYRARQETEQRYRALAERTDHNAETAIADADARADRFIADSRMRVKNACRSSRPALAATGDSGSTGADGPGESSIMVLEDDVRTCTSNTTRLQLAREWALGLNP